MNSIQLTIKKLMEEGKIFSSINEKKAEAAGWAAVKAGGNQQDIERAIKNCEWCFIQRTFGRPEVLCSSFVEFVLID